MNKAVLKRLAKVEIRYGVTAQSLEQKKRNEDVTVLLEMLEYFRKKMEMEETSSTSEELQSAEVQELEDSKSVVDWYCSYLKLSAEEQKKELERMDIELEVTVAKDKEWLNSEERKQFDLEYQRWLGSRSQSNVNLEVISGV